MAVTANAEREVNSLGASVADEIRVKLVRLRKTQTDLAGVLNCSQAAISRRMKGDVAFNLDELQRIAEFLGVPAASLLPAPEAVPA